MTTDRKMGCKLDGKIALVTGGQAGLVPLMFVKNQCILSQYTSFRRTVKCARVRFT
jgi:hypothetical protein